MAHFPILCVQYWYTYPGNNGARSAIAVWRSIFEMFFGLGENDRYSRIHIWVYMRHILFVCHSYQSMRHFLSTTIFGCIETRVDIKENGTWRFESYDSGGYFWKIQNFLSNCETYLRHFHIARLFIFQQMSIDFVWQSFWYKYPLNSHGNHFDANVHWILMAIILIQMSIEFSWQPFWYKCPLNSHGNHLDTNVHWSHME